MNFIERFFGISPDGGTGTFEFMVFLLPLGVVASLAYLRYRRSTDGT
jgi:hypothetical protein